MTYLDKLMETIKFNDELLTAEEIEDLRMCCRAGIKRNSRPWRHPSLKHIMENWIESTTMPFTERAWDVEIEEPARAEAIR